MLLYERQAIALSKNITIGLTGPTGAGKSMIAHRCLARGFGIVDGDMVSKKIYTERPDLIKELAAAFGEDIISGNGGLDRRRLGSKAFASKENMLLLNKITHPPIIEEIQCQTDGIFKEGKSVAVIDAAALIESGFYKKCDLVALVYAPSEIRLARIMARDALDEKSARQRISAQPPIEFYREKADIIINNCPKYDLEREMTAFFEKIKRYSS